MKISVAQIRPHKGDIHRNIEKHKVLIALAIAHGADALFFPELSLTAYEPKLAKDLVTQKNDLLLDVFQQISDENRIAIGLGLPLRAAHGIQIGMLVFQPASPRKEYAKQQLHADELPFFVPGEEQLLLTIENEKIAPAICYESLQADHAAMADKLGATIYLASVAKPQRGLDKAIMHYPEIARKYGMPVLMANCVGYCDNFESVGGSAVWDLHGEMVAQLDNLQEGILIYDTQAGLASQKYQSKDFAGK